MKTPLLCMCLFISLAFHSKAQIKIGDNPNTINPNSILEMEASNKGLLAPRVAISDINSASPLTAPVPSGMIVYSTGGTVTDGFYFWNGSKWLAVQSTANTRNNYVLVKSASDFPAAVSGIVTLAAGTTYEINGTIIMTNKINLNGCYLVGMDANNDKIIYTPATGELFTGIKGGTIKTLTLVANTTGAKLFNLDMVATENLLVRDAIIANCKNVGIVKGGNIVFFSVINYSGNTLGIIYENILNLLIDNAAWFSNNSNTYEKYVGTFEVIEKLGGFSNTQSVNSAVAMDITGITLINEVGNLKNTAFMGTGLRINGSFSNKWEVESPGIPTEKDDVAAGNLYLTSILATSFSASNVPKKISGSTTAIDLFRVSSPSNDRLTYTGTKTRRFAVIASLSVTAQAANKYFSFYVYKNGVLMPESEQAMRLSTGVDKGSVTISCTVQLAKNDYIEIWAANTSDASSLTVETLNLSIR